MIYLFSLFTLFQSYNIIWENNVVEIPLYESVEDYLYLPEANIYNGERLITNAEKYYEYGVNHTFISVVNSNHVKSFFVDYKVYFPEQNKTSIQTIEFKIVDVTPPKMVYVPELKSPLGTKIIDVKKDIIYEDNYYDVKDVQVFIDTSNVNVNKVGFYEVIYTLVDKSLNQTKHTAIYEVYDELPPIIKLKKDLYHEIKTPFRWQNYFSITDNDPNNLKVIVNDSFVDYEKLGKYIIIIEAIDNSLNKSIYEDVIEIVDTSPPELQLTSNPKHIEVMTPLSDLNLFDYVVMAKDNETKEIDLRWDITHDIDPMRIGTYQINFKVSDNSNNTSVKNLKVQVKDTTPPLITLIKPLSFEVYSEEVDVLNYFLFEDNFDYDFDLKIKVEGKINFNKIGIYPLTIRATDLSKNESVYKIEAYIIDTIAPTITPLKEVVINPNDDIDINDYFLFEDNYDDELEVYFDVPQNLDKIGTYQALVEVFDSSNNSTVLEFEIIVIDLEAPMIVLKQEQITITENEEIDFKSYVLSVYDNVSIVTIDDVIIDDSSFRSERGMYKIEYILFDEALNKAVESLYVYVVESDNISIEVSNLFIKPNQIITYMEGIVITGDNYEYYVYGNSSYKVEGRYTITHIIISEYGKVYNIEQQVNVSNSFNVRKHIIPLIAISFSILATVFLVVKGPKRNTNTFDK